MGGFDAINGCLCRMKGFKSHHGIRDFLDETVILFNQVIQIFNPTFRTPPDKQYIKLRASITPFGNRH